MAARESAAGRTKKITRLIQSLYESSAACPESELLSIIGPKTKDSLSHVPIGYMIVCLNTGSPSSMDIYKTFV